MTPTQMAFILPLATMTTLLTVVACGPSNDYVPVSITSGGGRGTSVVKACAQSLKNREFKVSPDNKKDVQVCVASRVSDGFEYKPKTVNYNVSYSSDDGVVVDLRAEIELPKFSEDAEKNDKQNALVSALFTSCGGLIEKRFAREGTERDSAVKINLEFGVTQEPAADADFAQTKMIFADDTHTSLILADWPDSDPLILPKSCGAFCGKPSKKAELNLPFCRTLARMAGHWLGLENPAEKRCSISRVSTKETTPGQKSFMVAATEDEPKEFFESAKLSREELRSILGPACEKSKKSDSSKQ